MTDTYPGEVGSTWFAAEESPILRQHGRIPWRKRPITHSFRLDPATCDDGSEFFMSPEMVFYAAVLDHERAGQARGRAQ